jgi:diguanylate cyclase (GGDEF)-like protein
MAKSRAQLSWRLILPVAGVYLAWGALAFLSHLAGRTTMTPTAAGLLIAAILTTNLLLTVLRLPDARADSIVATAQSGLAIAWSSVYAVLADGTAELVPGMYLTAVLIAFTRVPANRLRELGLAAAGGYALSILVRLLPAGPTPALWGEALQGCAVIAMLALLARRARQSEDHRRGLSHQISRLQEEVERITRNSERDHLTKSFNRQYIMDSLLREKARADRTGRCFSICIFDLDRFKALNDQHGHLVGDRVLTAFANRARRALRSMDALNPTRFRRALGRLGGEEFVAVLPGTEIGGALRCAERIREIVAREPVERDLQITVSAGVAEYRQGESIPELLTRADQAMYVAKRSGRNRVRVSASRPPRPKEEVAHKPNLRVVR